MKEDLAERARMIAAEHIHVDEILTQKLGPFDEPNDAELFRIISDAVDELGNTAPADLLLLYADLKKVTGQ